MDQLGERIAGKITAAAPTLAEQWPAAAAVRHFYLDDLLKPYIGKSFDGEGLGYRMLNRLFRVAPDQTSTRDLADCRTIHNVQR